ncbi:MAG TPA: DNA polymerase III subunit epsilon [Gammaproteobacteria bacterium]|nr:DNA polymerase III subunit epsilon [Gammaproteobacteria bacterium]
MRQVVLDTETTGLDAAAGHRIIEIGCVELLYRRYSDRNFHRYVNPERSVDPGALAVHGIEEEFLAMQPIFGDIVDEFLEFVEGSELVIHNAGFDVGFINEELKRLGARIADIRDICEVRDTLALARRMHPGQRNSLDALAKRYMVDNSMRELHGALLDARILAEVYLVMTGGQTSLMLDAASTAMDEPGKPAATLDRAGLDLVVLAASDAELDAHDAMLERIRKLSGRAPIWDEIAAREAETPY